MDMAKQAMFYECHISSGVSRSMACREFVYFDRRIAPSAGGSAVSRHSEQSSS
jgi:predicted nucleic-acid-binding protein